MATAFQTDILQIELDGSGNATVTSNRHVRGVVLEIEYVQGGMGTPTTVTITSTDTPTGVDRTHLTLSSPAANGIYRIRLDAHDATGSASGTANDVIDGKLKAAVVGGTASGTGQVVMRWLEA